MRPPVLLIHGTFSRPAFWSPWIERLEAEGYACHARALPGRDPTDEDTLRSVGLREHLDVVRAARDRFEAPPIVIGHSMGGLLAQKLAAATDTAALVLVASVPPGTLWAQPSTLPALARLMPRILKGAPILPPPKTMRSIPLSTLAPEEQEEVVPKMVRDSGRAFRSLVFGSRVTRIPRGAVRCPVLCVSGGADRNVSAWLSRRVAVRYGAEHHIHPGKPHWIIAESAVDDVLPPILDWLRRAT